LSDLHNKFAVQSAAVTVFEPASERGNGGVDELQEQTVNLLNFQQVENKVFAGQLAFNVLSEREASYRTEKIITEQLGDILGKTFPRPMVMAVQAPVFHSHAFSIFVQMLAAPSLDDLSAHLKQNKRFSVDASAGGPSPISVVGTDTIHIGRMQPMPAADSYAFWVVADNLRIAASNALQTAEQIMLAPALGM
jgi:aspartate-semialdehyde dehydrogenase